MTSTHCLFFAFLCDQHYYQLLVFVLLVFFFVLLVFFLIPTNEYKPCWEEVFERTQFNFPLNFQINCWAVGYDQHFFLFSIFTKLWSKELVFLCSHFPCLFIGFQKRKLHKTSLWYCSGFFLSLAVSMQKCCTNMFCLSFGLIF